ncbi:cupin domain-containing protein [Chloroflexota bacterium]
MDIVSLTKMPVETIEGSPNFTGTVKRQKVFEEPGHALVSNIGFTKGVRNKFHAHSGEQILIVTEGKGWVATETKKVEVGPGDIIRFAPGEKHWHGALPDSEFTHVFVAPADTKTEMLED